jgi:hypothetical protein
VAHGLIASASLTTSLWGWASFGASVAAILIGAASLIGLTRRRRRHRPPTPPPPGATLDEWDDYSIRVDQWADDLED